MGSPVVRLGSSSLTKQLEMYLEVSSDCSSISLVKDRVSQSTISIEIAASVTGRVVAFGRIRLDDIYNVLKQSLADSSGAVTGATAETGGHNRSGVLRYMQTAVLANSVAVPPSKFRVLLEEVDTRIPWGQLECQLSLDNIHKLCRPTEPRRRGEITSALPEQPAVRDPLWNVTHSVSGSLITSRFSSAAAAAAAAASPGTSGIQMRRILEGEIRRREAAESTGQADGDIANASNRQRGQSAGVKTRLDNRCTLALETQTHHLSRKVMDCSLFRFRSDSNASPPGHLFSSSGVSGEPNASPDSPPGDLGNLSRISQRFKKQ
eukprot:GHVT01039491.1.p1 GENE.GHVT01039491.1~~GHVT01039491.1.p1  ORF type:complete len:321 (-),score=25.81 GHVT01039491.1:1571-2533(-)